jgi:hypothetical protein
LPASRSTPAANVAQRAMIDSVELIPANTAAPRRPSGFLGELSRSDQPIVARVPYRDGFAGRRSELDDDANAGFVDPVPARDFTPQFVDQSIAAAFRRSGRRGEQILFLEAKHLDHFLEVLRAGQPLAGFPIPDSLPADAKPFGKRLDRPASFVAQGREPFAQAAGDRSGFLRHSVFRMRLRVGAEQRGAYGSGWNRFEKAAAEERSAGPNDLDVMNACSRQLDFDNLPDRQGLLGLHEHSAGREVMDPDFTG